MAGSDSEPGLGHSLKVAVQLPGLPQASTLEERFAIELEALAPIGARLVEVAARDETGWIAEARDAQAILTSWGVPIGRRVIESLDNCVVIGVGSIGTDMVDVDAATEAGIVVTNVPDVFIEEVADHAMALLLAAARRLGEMSSLVAGGGWWEGRARFAEVPRLRGQTLGLVAFGSVARAVARRAQPFGLRVLAHDPYLSELVMTEADVEPVGLSELLERSDFVSLHLPLNDETRHWIGAAELARMKRGAILVNTARGGVVDEAALIAALEAGSIAGAALDVLEREPPAAENPLRRMANVVVTPHVASASSRMRPETRRRAAREVALALAGRWPMSCVNPDVLPRVPLERWQPYSMSRGPNR